MASHMDRFDEMRIFTRIVERRSFTVAAEELQLPRASVTNAIKRLEARVGTRLLERTTRVVAATLDGQAYYAHCVRLLADLSEMESVFTRSDPSGLLRVSLHPALARHFVAPALPAFLDRYPGIELQISESDRLVDLVREGVDCMLRVDELLDSSVVMQEVARLPMVTCASPIYLNRHGRPATLEALERHRAVNLVSTTTTRPRPFQFTVDDTTRQIMMPSAVTVTGADMYVASTVAGLGIAQIPRHRVDVEQRQHPLEVLLPHMPPPPKPVYVVYPRSRQLSPRVRVFADFLRKAFKNIG